MENEIKVSIIMPVYNSEKYVGKAIESVLNQTFREFELLLIDDGSTDRSGSICDEYGTADSRVKVVHQSNRGISCARNCGIDLAVGEYIGFIDNDDFYYKDYIKDNYVLGSQYNADVVRFDRLRVRTFENSPKQIKDISGTRGMFEIGENVSILKKDELIKQYSKIKKSGALYGVWNALYKRSFLNEHNLRFNEEIRYGGEDLLINLEVLEKAQIYVFHKGVYYRYERRYGNSTSTKFHINRLKTLVMIAKKEKDILKTLVDYPILWLYNQIDYSIAIIQIFSHKDCPWNLRKKIQYLKYFVNRTIFKNPDYRKYIWRVFKMNPILGIMGGLFYGQHFMMCFLVVNGYEVFERLRR